MSDEELEEEMKDADEEGEEELQKADPDLDFVKERIADESGGVEAYSQALESIQDPQLKEIIQAIHEDESKHHAALQQWMEEHGGSGEDDAEEDQPADEPGEEPPEEGELPEDLPEEEDKGEGPMDLEELQGDDEAEEEEKDDDMGEDEGSDKGDLIADIMAVLAEHSEDTEKADEPEEGEGEEELEEEEKADDKEDDEDLPDFLKEDDEDEDEDELDKCHAPVKKFMPIVKLDEEQHKAFCVVAKPGEFDKQGDRTSREEVEKAAHRFMERMQKSCSRGVGVNHEKPIDAYVIENVVTQHDGVRLGKQILKAGTWYQGHKIDDDRVWKLIKSGQITGLSRQGEGIRTPVGKGVFGPKTITKGGRAMIQKGERFDLSDEEIDRIDWVEKGANGQRIAIIKFVDKPKEGSITMREHKPAGARKGAGAGEAQAVTKADILGIIEKAIAPIQEENSKLRKQVEKQNDILRKKDYVDIAKSHFDGVVGPEEGAEILKSMEGLPSEARKLLFKTLKQTSAMRKEAGKMLFSPLGGNRPTPGSATEQFEAIVKQHLNVIQKSDTGGKSAKVLRARAVSKAAQENPELARAVMTEHKANVHATFIGGGRV